MNILKSHRSIRKYKDRPIEPHILKEILDVGLRASSSGNMQPYSIIITTDEVLKKKLHPLHFNQEMVLEAPALITFCADFHRMRRWLKLSEAPMNFDNPMSFMIGAIDAIIASQNVAIAAEAHGLGICYMGTTLANCKKIGEVFKLPKHVYPVVGFSIGYPDENPERRDRLPLTSIIHKETYHEPSDEEILQGYKERELKGFKRYRENVRLNKMMRESGSKNLAQIYTKAKYTRETHLKYSKDLIQYLEEQDFLNLQ